MNTEEELAEALAALQRCSPEELAAFIVSWLCGAPPGIQSHAEAFIAVLRVGANLRKSQQAARDLMRNIRTCTE